MKAKNINKNKLLIIVASIIITLIIISTAMITKASEGMSREVSMAPYSSNVSIGGIISAQDQTKLVLIPMSSSFNYMTYPTTEAGLKQALYKMYESNNQDDYTLYFGTNITAGTAVATHVGRKTPPLNPSETDITFTSLEGRISSLTLVGSFLDPLDSTNTVPTGTKLLSLNTDVFFSTDITFRNFSYSMVSVLAQGNKLTLDRGSVSSRITSYYGGTDEGDITANPVIDVYSTSIYPTSKIFGGNKTSGTVNGNITLNIYNTTVGINTIAGGGEGTNLNRVHVNGNISTTIHGLGGVLSNYYGSNIYGDVTGTVTNHVSGIGGTLGGVGTPFVGGAKSGNVGSPGHTGDAITTYLDTTQYTIGRVDYIGGNELDGTVYGNIINTISAGEYNKGGMYTISGGTGYDGYVRQSVVPLNGIADFQKATVEEVKNAFLNSTATVHFKVYGNIVNDIKGGSVGAAGSRGYMRSAGYAGYIEGNVTTQLGKDRLAYSDNRIATTNMDHSIADRTKAFNTGWDIVGAGGFEGRETRSILIVGDTDLVFHNVLARWTYGSGFGGYIYGNTNITLHEGIVDTLEGSGYMTKYQWGNPTANVYNGQVDWFLSGGGWEDHFIYGNPSVTVYGGTINASMGASYGASNTHAIYGNSTMLIKGGNFRGSPRTGNNGFSGGITNAGSLYGNAKLTLDLRDAETGDFQLPVGTYITGGRPYNVNTTLGLNDDSTIELNIFTKSGSNILGNASIYGDGGAIGNAVPQGYTVSKNITINIDAPDSVIKEIYATNYNNVIPGVSGGILRNVTYNISAAKSIGTLSGGSATDIFTNGIIKNGDKKVIFNIKTPIEKEIGIIGIGDGGIFNFTNLNIDHSILTAEGVGSILNGRTAKADNHGTLYNDFGDVTIKNNGGFGIGSTAIVSVGNVNIDEQANFTSPAGDGKFNLTSLDFVDADANIKWVNAGGAKTSATGTWFGPQTNTAYQVLTFTPDKNKANAVMPWTLTGTDIDGKKYYAGDNDVTKSDIGYGLAVEALRFDFEVTEGLGKVSHNLEKATSLPATPPIEGAISSVGKDILVDKGWLIIPLNKIATLKPKFTFQPDITSGSWVKEVSITSTDGYNSLIPEQDTTAPYIWSLPAAQSASYSLKGKFSDAPEISAINMVITEKQATEITSKQNIIDYQIAKGRPFFEHTITDALYNEIIQPIALDKKYRVHDITYTSGKDGGKITTTVKLFIVPNGTIIDSATNPKYALFAKDAMLTVTQANALVDRAELDNNHTGAFGLDIAAGTEITPGVSPSTIVSDINGVSSPAMFPTTYSIPTLTKVVNITIVADKPELLSTPDLEFGQFKITGRRTRVSLVAPATVQIRDERPGSATWSLNLQTTDFTYNDGTTTFTIDGAGLIFVESSGVTHPLKGGHIVANGTSGSAPISVVWPVGKTNGILFESLGTEVVGKYEADLTWTLQFVP